jgi:hypothetical protein
MKMEQHIRAIAGPDCTPKDTTSSHNRQYKKPA